MLFGARVFIIALPIAYLAFAPIIMPFKLYFVSAIAAEKHPLKPANSHTDFVYICWGVERASTMVGSSDTH